MGSRPGDEMLATLRSRTNDSLVFFVLATAALVFSLLASMVIPAVPELQRALHANPSAASWLFTGFLVSAAICTPILGRVGDAWGKEKMIVIVQITFCLGTLLCAVATALPLMLAGRVLQGVGGAIFPLAYGIIRDEFPAERVPSSIGVMSAMLGVGTGLGIVLAGPILDNLSYHWLFLLPLMLGSVTTVAIFLVVPESPVRAPGGINVWGAVFMSGWLLTGLIGVSYGPTWGWTNPTVLVLFVMAVVLTLLWIRSETRSPCPLVDMQMMRIPTVWTTNVAALLFGCGMFAMFALVPAFAQTPRGAGYGFGASVTGSGLILLPFAVAMFVIAPMTGRVTTAFGPKPTLIAGGAVSALSYLVLIVAHTEPWTLYVATGLLGIGVALGYASLINLILQAVPRSQTGVASGMNTNFRSVGAAIGSAVAASLMATGRLADGLPAERGYIEAFAVCAMAMVVAAGVAVKVPGRRAGPGLDDAVPVPSEADVVLNRVSLASPELS
jgi:MFS family permease